MAWLCQFRRRGNISLWWFKTNFSSVSTRSNCIRQHR